MSIHAAGFPAGTYRPPPAAPLDADGGPELVARCRAALARWIATAGERLRALTAEETAQAAADRYAARLPRPASSDGCVVQPGMRRETWFRTARLMQRRAEREFGGRARPGPRPGGPPPLARVDQAAERHAAEQWRRAFCTTGVRQMIAILGDECGADTRGRIDNVGAFLARYCKAVGCRKSAAYEHWQAVTKLGLVRQTRAPAGWRPDDDQGRSTTHARYVLCWPAALLPEGLPTAADALTAAPLAPQAAAWDHDADHVALDAGDESLHQYGSCRTSQTPARAPGTQGEDEHHDQPNISISTYYLEAWPLYARVSPPSPARTAIRSGDKLVSHRSGGISDDERSAAAGLLTRCRPLWARQGQNLSDDATAQISPLIAIALRYTATLDGGDLVDLLTDRVRTARDLGRVLRRRLQQLVTSLRRRCDIEVDDNGAQYEQATAQRAADAATAYASTAASRAAARTELEAARARLAVQRTAQRASVAVHQPCAVEDESVLANELAAQRGYTPAAASPALSPAESAARRRAARSRAHTR